MKRIIPALSLGLLTSCASSGSGWNQADWLGLQTRNFNSGPWKFSAEPVRGNGFKMKFAINLDDILAGSTADGDVTPLTEADLVEAAKAAAPEGCSFKSLTRSGDGSFEADYDCG